MVDGQVGGIHQLGRHYLKREGVKAAGSGIVHHWEDKSVTTVEPEDKLTPFFDRFKTSNLTKKKKIIVSCIRAERLRLLCLSIRHDGEDRKPNPVGSTSSLFHVQLQLNKHHNNSHLGFWKNLPGGCGAQDGDGGGMSGIGRDRKSQRRDLNEKTVEARDPLKRWREHRF